MLPRPTQPRQAAVCRGDHGQQHDEESGHGDPPPADPRCAKAPVMLADRDVAVLIGVLAVLEGEVRSGEASPRMTRHLSDRLARCGLLAADVASEGLARALSDMNQRLRVARGEYDGVP